MHTYLVTGATGTLGRAVTRDILSQGDKVRMYSRTVRGHEEWREYYTPHTPSEAPRVTTIIGSLHSWVDLDTAFQDVDYVIHAAALKDIQYAEEHPRPTIETNVRGTENVIRACLRHKVKRAVFISTDKAAAPTTLYGATKLLGERLWLGSQTYTGGKTPDFVAVRYGNVWGSARSVLHKFTEQAQTNGFLSITDPRATRFHIRLSEAVALVLKVLHQGLRGTLTVPKLPTYSVGDLSHAFSSSAGIKNPVHVTGLRASEKLHEDLIAQNETPMIMAETSTQYTLNPKYALSPLTASYSSGAREHQLSRADLEQEIQEWRSANQGVPWTHSPSVTRSSSASPQDTSGC